MAEERGIALAFRNQCQVFFLAVQFPSNILLACILSSLPFHVCLFEYERLRVFYHLRGGKKPSTKQTPKT